MKISWWWTKGLTTAVRAARRPGRKRFNNGMESRVCEMRCVGNRRLWDRSGGMAKNRGPDPQLAKRDDRHERKGTGRPSGIDRGCVEQLRGG